MNLPHLTQYYMMGNTHTDSLIHPHTNLRTHVIIYTYTLYKSYSWSWATKVRDILSGFHVIKCPLLHKLNTYVALIPYAFIIITKVVIRWNYMVNESNPPLFLDTPQKLMVSGSCSVILNGLTEILIYTEFFINRNYWFFCGFWRRNLLIPLINYNFPRDSSSYQEDARKNGISTGLQLPSVRLDSRKSWRIFKVGSAILYSTMGYSGRSYSWGI